MTNGLFGGCFGHFNMYPHLNRLNSDLPLKMTGRRVEAKLANCTFPFPNMYLVNYHAAGHLPPMFCVRHCHNCENYI